jgi:clathrin heavy chain
MIERSADAWEHNQFKDVIVRAANVEMYLPFLLIVIRN